MTTPTASGAHTHGEWNISAPAHGVFLNNGSYCVARLDGKDPRELWLQISHANALLAERDALKAEVSALSARCAEMEKDAQRYRWLRQGNGGQIAPDFWGESDDDIDSYIDSSLASQESKT
jgi:hypothetical protein